MNRVNKFFKIFSLIITFVIAFCMVGCGDANTNIGVANNLERSANKLSNIISNLEEMNYDDIIINDISPIDGTSVSNRNYSQNANTKYQITTQNRTLPNSQYALTKSKSYALGSQNALNSVKTSTPKPQRDATFVNATGDKIGLASNEKRPISPNTITKNISNTITNSNKKSCDNGQCENNSKSNNKTKTLVNNSVNKSNNLNNKYTNPSIKYSNISNKSYPANQTSNYKTRYVNETTENFTRNSLNSYIVKIEALYEGCADCVSCGAECKNEQTNLCQNIADCKTLCSKLRDGTINLTEQEILECNSLIENLKGCSTRLNSTRGNIYSKSKDITKLKVNFSNNINSLNSAYEKLYSALESRLDSLVQCNEYLEQVSDIINKTKVDKKQAEFNKSNEEDIEYNQERLNEEEKNFIDNYDENNFNNNLLNNDNYLNNFSNNNYQTDTFEQSNINKINTENQDNRNDDGFSNNINNLNNNSDKNMEITNQRNKNFQTTQYPQQGYTNQSQDQVIPQNINNTIPYNQPIVNNYGYNGYGPYQNNGYRPYPPRNIDTYRTINKNIDTYRPYTTPYIPQQAITTQSNNNNMPISDNKQIIEDNDIVKDNIVKTEENKTQLKTNLPTNEVETNNILNHSFNNKNAEQKVDNISNKKETIKKVVKSKTNPITQTKLTELKKVNKLDNDNLAKNKLSNEEIDNQENKTEIVNNIMPFQNELKPNKEYKIENMEDNNFNNSNKNSENDNLHNTTENTDKNLSKTQENSNFDDNTTTTMQTRNEETKNNEKQPVSFEFPREVVNEI